MKLFDKEVNSLFKQELNDATKVTLSKSILEVNVHIHAGIKFIKDYGKYKDRVKYKLTDVEYQEKIDLICLEFQEFMTRLVIAEKLLEINGLKEIYDKNVKQIYGLINNLMKTAKQRKTTQEVKDGNKIHNTKSVQNIRKRKGHK